MQTKYLCILIKIKGGGGGGQVWYLIVSIPDLCTLTYFHVLLLFKRNNFNNCLIRSKSEK